ncbi:cell wall / vacuolar inhibitor of fructosidase 2 [Phtheirospermum japonicum]|uniref:Cell wall / vacuolar inhibitor of fructosidase 2 n=1 Tax=Phtheirospermum japonicum TaxID=374723 RepID=A0A830CZ25_9LAMI|nr:cell wall / vacuolar inhibitor of fructosidase 2 [Phtheirospermum japonicum]
MGFSWFVLSLILFFSFDPILSANHENPNLIQQTCKNTKYYDLCVSSLKSDSSSPKADTKGLALIMVKVGMANATATNTYLSSQMLTAKNETVLKKVMKECADKYGFANEALQRSVQDLSDEFYDYAYMHVMAAADYPISCRNAFKRYSGLIYPPELAVREDGLTRICDVVLEIIDALGF